MGNDNPFDKVVELLEHPSNSLKALAYISGYDPFSFYRGADLSNLDISDQDLTGLNFDGAELRGCNLSGVLFDKGAFNNAIIDEKFSYLNDGYDTYISDLISENTKNLHFFGKFRSEFIDKIVDSGLYSYGEISRRMNISTATLRKARRSEMLSIETVSKIADYLNSDEFIQTFDVSNISQPCVMVFSMDGYSDFVRIKREHITYYRDVASNFLAWRVENGYRFATDVRETAQTLHNMNNISYVYSGYSKVSPPLELDVD